MGFEKNNDFLGPACIYIYTKWIFYFKFYTGSSNVNFFRKESGLYHASKKKIIQFFGSDFDGLWERLRER